MFDLIAAYRPEEGRCKPVENEIIRHIRRETRCDDWFLHLSEGRWVVSTRLPNGYVMDVGDLGEGPLPDQSRVKGLIRTLISFKKAEHNQRGPVQEALRLLEERRKRQLEALQAKQAEYDERMGFIGRHLRSGRFADHAMFRGAIERTRRRK